MRLKGIYFFWQTRNTSCREAKRTQLPDAMKIIY